MEILLIAITGTLNLVCFYIGAKLGQKVSRGETIEMPTINPIEIIKEHQEKKEAEREAEREQNYIDTVLRNAERYDGTPYGQEDVPRG